MKRYLVLLMVLFAALMSPVASSTAAPDTADPVVGVDLPRDSTLTSPIALTGTASDNVAISKIRVSIKDQDSKLWLQPDGTWETEEFRFYAELTPAAPAALVAWSFTAELPDGSYFANIRAADTSNNHNAIKPFFSFHVAGDDAPPSVTTDLPRGAAFDGGFAFGGTADDDFGVRKVKVGIRDRDTGQWLRGDGSFASGVHRLRADMQETNTNRVDWTMTLELDTGSYAASIVASDTNNQKTAIIPWVRFTVGTEPGTELLVAAGDVAKCGYDGAHKTADLLDRIFAERDGTLALLGDGAYQDGKPSEYANCYDPTWGRHKGRTKPAAGNHDYNTRDAAGYFGYFGSRAGDPDKGYYAYNLGKWRILVLNTECDEIGGCGKSSPQYEWLENQFANNNKQCVLAYGHKPRFNSGPHENEPKMREIFKLLYNSGTTVFLGGHSHNYQRYAKLAADGTAAADGVQSFIVGTGGTTLRDVEREHPRLRKFIENRHGVLVLELGAGEYGWEFIDVDDQVRDSGSGTC